MRDELALLGAQLTYKKRLEGMLQELKNQEDPLAKKVALLEARMIQERRDVDRLEGRSLSAFVYYAIGRKEAKLDAERREFYAARVKYDAAARELESIRQDIEATEEDLRDLRNCEAQYAQALERKRSAIEAAGLPESGSILVRGRELNQLRCQAQELEEAVEAGTQALQTLHAVSENLRDAEDWSTIDLWGAGKFADMAKQETLDEVQRSIEQLQIHLQKFNKELSDVAIRADRQSNIDAMLHFAESFFENIFTDSDILGRVKQARQQMEQTRDQILGLLRQLQTQLELVRHRYQSGKAALDQMVVDFELNT